jgi:hypothetical protein
MGRGLSGPFFVGFEHGKGREFMLEMGRPDCTDFVAENRLRARNFSVRLLSERT